MPAWYERRVESAIAWDWSKASRCAKGLLLTQELELVPSLLLGRGDRTKVCQAILERSFSGNGGRVRLF